MADIVIGFHFLFIVYVLLGGFLVFRWPKTAWAHVPCFLWGAIIEIGGWICPLTYLENHLRQQETEAAASFVETHIMPLIYPELLFPGAFPRSGFIWIGLFVLALNAVIYWRVWRKHGGAGG